MAHGVFLHRFDSPYDDSPAERYHFPKSYLGRVQACVGDWVLYLEPSKVRDSRGYFAVARVQSVSPDPARERHFYAEIEPGSYLDFASPVPFRDQEGVVEQSLLNDSGAMSGRAQAAVRKVPSSDFLRILERGLSEVRGPDLSDANEPITGLAEEQALYQHDSASDEAVARIRISALATRTLRDRVFRKSVITAYRERCAITGLRLINGGGRAEVEAAHIRPVSADGPDIVSNGLALCGTAHWMFDRGLFSITDDLRILVSRQTNDPDGARALVNPSGVLIAPNRASERPHPSFLHWHREHCFKT